MGLLESCHQNFEERIDRIKAIAETFGAKYSDNMDIVYNTFDIELDSDFNDANIIIGEKDGYDYCFLDTYHISENRKDPSGWKSILILENKNKRFPDFRLVTKNKAISEIITQTLMALFLFILPLAFFYLTYIYPSESSKDTSSRIASIFIGVICVMSLFFSLLFFLNLIQYKDIFQQNKYRLIDDFKEKYVILNANNPQEINKLFTDEICSRIFYYREDIDLTFHKNCTIFRFGFNEKLSFDSCDRALNDLINKVELFIGNSN